MKISYNPKSSLTAITTETAANDDIIFDLYASKLWAKGVRIGADWADISSKPSSLKNPYALTISLNGTSQGPYDGSAAKSINITPSSIGAATSGHNHDGRYVYNYGSAGMNGASVNKNALGMSSNSGITGDWWHILQAAWNLEYRWNSQIAFPTLNRNGMYYRSGLDDNTAWGDWIKLLDVGNSYVKDGKGIINGTTITQVDNATNASVASKVYGQVGDTGSHELVRCDMNNDRFRIIAGSNGNNNGWAEIATADDGNEPIYVRQYTGEFGSIKRTLTLLDANGYTHFPSYINIGGNENNNSSPDRVWGSNSSDSYLRSYRTSALRVSYANSAGNADTLDGTHLNGIFTAFLANGNATRLVIGGITKDLAIPYSIKSNLLYSYSLPYTNYDKVGWYCKIASVSITTLYSSKTALLCITDEYTVTSSSARYGLIYIKMQQQNALGSSPNVVIRVSGSLTTSLVTGILTLSSTTSKLDIYLKEDLPYLKGYISFIHGALDIRTNSLELIQTLPSGTIINSQYGDISNQSASLLNSHKINGTSFNGTSDITTAYWGTTRTISLTGAITGSVSTNGGSNITINTTYGTGNISNLDSRYLKRTGDTMSGTLSFSPTESLDGAPKIYSIVSGSLTSLNFEVSNDTNDRFVFKINYYGDTDATNRERFTIDWNNVISKAPITAPSFNGNTTSATKLQTTRLLWGNSFDGTTDINDSIVFPAIGDTATSNKISWSGSTDGADIYYLTTATDLGNLVLNVKDDTNAYILLALNGVFKSHFDVANSYWTGRSAQADKWTTARTFTIGNTAKNVDGSGNVSWSLSEIGVRDTWRTVQVNGTSIGNNTLNLCGSTYIGLTNVNGKVTFSLVGSGTTANQAILSNGTANGWTLKTLNIDNWDTAYNFVSTITGTDTDDVINKWDEIVNFLAGITEDNKLNTLLNSKLSILLLTAEEILTTKTNNALYWVDTKSTAGSITTGPFTDHPYALLSVTNYNKNAENNKFFYRSRLAFSSAGDIKVASCHHENEYKLDEAWYNVLTSKNSGIDGSTIKLNGTSITVYSSSTADGRYVKKSGDTMTGALNFANNIWNNVGDDVAIGDINSTGCLGLRARTGTYSGITFVKNDGTVLNTLMAYGADIKYGSHSLMYLSNGSTSVVGSTWMNPFTAYDKDAVKDGLAICVWGQGSSLSNLSSDGGNIALYLKRVNAKAATLNMVLDGEYYANGNLRLAHVSEIPTKNSWNYDDRYLKLDGSSTMTGQIKSSYSAGTWIAGCTNAILKATADGYNSLICAPIKSGNISISAWTNEENLNFGYAIKGKTENSFDTKMYWDAPNNNLHAAAFTGHLYGTADNATNSDKLDGYHASGLLTTLSNSNRGISLTVGGTTKSVNNISVGDADTVDGYHISDESRQVYKNHYTVDNPASAWILIKLPAYNAVNEIITISGYGSNRQAHCEVHCGSRFQGIWGYLSDYNGIVVDRIRWKEVDSGKFAIVALINGGITTLTIKATNSLEISKTTEDTKAFTITANFFSIGGVFYGNAASATKVIVNLHTANDANYPLVWSNLSNTSSATENQLHKSWLDLYYNPKNKRLFVGGSVSTVNINATGTVTSAGFKHSEVTENADLYVLTADGRYTFLNLTSNELAHEFDVNITVTSEWLDIEDFYGGNLSFLTLPGTYIVLVYYTTNSANSMYEGYFSGIMSWYTGTTNSNNADEIVLHRVGHAYANTIYLRTRESLRDDPHPYTKLQISANSDLKQHTYKFKFKRIC